MLAVIVLSVAPVLLLVALAVRFAGNARILNTIDYSRITSAPALHRWAGNRLLLLPLLAVVIGGLCLRYATLAVPLIMVFAAGIFAVAIWLAVGSSKFSVSR